MTMDDVLRVLAPLTPAVLPLMVIIWRRTRRELHDIQSELLELRQRPSPPDPRLDELLEAVDTLGAEVARLADAQRRALAPGPEREDYPG
jgi:hypothetical protein